VTQATPVLPKLPFDYATWNKDTYLPPAVTDLTGQAKFKVLDKAVEAYLKAPSQASLTSMRDALYDWTGYKDRTDGAGAWRKSNRNKKLSVSVLMAAIEGMTDTDKGVGIPDFMSEGMLKSRLGILYLFAHLGCDEGVFRFATNGLLDLNGKGEAKGKDARRDTESAAIGAPRPARDATEAAACTEVTKALRETSASLATAACSQSEDGLDDSTTTHVTRMWDMIPGGQEAVCSYLAYKLMDEVSPFLSNSVHTVRGIRTAVQAASDRYALHVRGKAVVLVPGVPTSTIDGVKRAMDLSLAGDVYEVLKRGTVLAMEGLAPVVAGKIAEVAFSAVEALIAITRKVYELYRLRLFMHDAAAFWGQRDAVTSLHRQPYAFNRWYRKAALRVPAIPSLAMKSGLCGDKMHMLCMFTGEGEVISQQRFDEGVLYIDKIKAWGTEYLAGCGYAFTSKEKLVASALGLPVK